MRLKMNKHKNTSLQKVNKSRKRKTKQNATKKNKPIKGDTKFALIPYLET